MHTIQRTKVRFDSDGTDCVAWHYPGTNGGCVVMAAGGAVTKEPGTDPFAARFQEAGFAVLAFDYRGLGESGGGPRQVLNVGRQLADWDAALAFAATLPGVVRIAGWGFSLSGGHLFPVAARHPELAAVIAQNPLADGPAAMPNALRHETLGVILSFPLVALRDACRGLVGREPLLIPLAGPRGTTAMLTTPDAQDGDRALNPGNRYPEWRQVVAARSVLRLGGYRPGRYARRVRCPLLVVVADDDRSALAGPALRAAGRARAAEVVHVSGGHYAPFLDAYDEVVAAELDFLHRHLLG